MHKQTPFFPLFQNPLKPDTSLRPSISQLPFYRRSHSVPVPPVRKGVAQDIVVTCVVVSVCHSFLLCLLIMGHPCFGMDHPETITTVPLGVHTFGMEHLLLGMHLQLHVSSSVSPLPVAAAIS